MLYEDWDVLLEGDSIRLTPFSQEDSDRFFLLQQETKASDLNETEMLFKSILNYTEKNETHAIRLKDGPEMIGWINLQRGTEEEPGVGIKLFREYRNHGYGSEAVKLLLNEVHRKYRITRARVCINRSNHQSQRCFAKLGAVCTEGVPTDEELSDYKETWPGRRNWDEYGFEIYSIELPIA